MAIQSSNSTIQNEQFKKQVLDSVTAWLTNYTSERTQQAYKRVLASFSKFNEGNLLKATMQDVIDYRDYLSNDLKRANTTINQHLYAIRAFYAHLVDKNIIEASPAIEVKTTKVTPYGKTKSLSIKKNEHITLLQSIDRSDEMGARDYAIIVLLLTTGLRVSAITNATIKDIEQSGDNNLLHYDNKGGEQKTKQLTPEAMQAMKHYFSYRVISENSPLFATIRGKSGNPSQQFGHGMSRVAISKMITKRAKQAGVSNISAHSLRHTAALYLQSKNESVSAIQKFLGHSDKRTTLIYLDHLDDDTDDRLTTVMSGITG